MVPERALPGCVFYLCTPIRHKGTSAALGVRIAYVCDLKCNAGMAGHYSAYLGSTAVHYQLVVALVSGVGTTPWSWRHGDRSSMSAQLYQPDT